MNAGSPRQCLITCVYVQGYRQLDGTFAGNTVYTGYHVTWKGKSSLTTGYIPSGTPGEFDIVTCRDENTGVLMLFHVVVSTHTRAFRCTSFVESCYPLCGSSCSCLHLSLRECIRDFSCCSLCSSACGVSPSPLQYPWSCFLLLTS